MQTIKIEPSNFTRQTIDLSKYMSNQYQPQTIILNSNQVLSRKKQNFNLAVLMMIGNENQQTLERTLKSISDLFPCDTSNLQDDIALLESKQHKSVLYVLDTSSSEKECEKIMKELCDKHHIQYKYKYSKFEDFSTNRNQLLDWLRKENKYDFYLLLDANDEVSNSLELYDFLPSLMNHTADAFYLTQIWKYTKPARETKYKNIKLLRNIEFFTYKCPVHEYLDYDDQKAKVSELSGISLNQERDEEDTKSSKRWEWDMKVLENELKKDAHDVRSLFYLGQTYVNLNFMYRAITCYQKILELYKDKNYKQFKQEAFTSALRIAMIQISYLENMEEAKKYLLKALELDSERFEPWFYLGKIYYDTLEKEHFGLAYHFLKISCEKTYPEQGLFVDNVVFNYHRYSMFLKICRKIGDKKDNDAKLVAKILMKVGQQYLSETDKSNIEYYLE